MINNDIRLLREHFGLTQEALAHQLNLTASQLGRRERGEVELRAEEISKLMEIFKCSYDDLMRRR